MSPIPDFVVEIRKKIGHDPLWLPGVTAVVLRGEEILLVRRADNGQWTPITGIPEPAEEPAACAMREAMEETGVRVRVDRLASTSSHGGIVHANGDQASYLDLTFACTWLSGEAHVADDESSEVRWWPLQALPPMSDVMMARIDAALSDEREARFVGAPTAGDAQASPSPLRPPVPVLGVAACDVGWVGVVVDTTARTSVFVAATVDDLVELVRESHEVGLVATAADEAPDDDGMPLSREALTDQGIAVPPFYRGAGFGEDHLLDACAAALSAVRHPEWVTTP